MYGLIERITTLSGQRDQLAGILTSLDSMPGCLSYIVANDPSAPDVLWVTETWENTSAHTDSLQLPHIQRAMQAGGPLIANFERIAETDPVGGLGLG